MTEKTKNLNLSMNPENNIRLGVFDKDGKFIGFKTDTTWSLDEEYFKADSLENGGIRQVIKKNLLSMLNKLNDPKELKDSIFNGCKVVALPLDRDVPQEGDVSFWVVYSDKQVFEIREG